MSETTIDQATFNELQELTGADFINELIDTFLADAPLMLADLQKALAEADIELFRRTAHSLKSNGRSFGALRLSALAKELEDLGREKQLGSVGDKLEQLNLEYGRVETALKGMRHG